MKPIILYRPSLCSDGEVKAIYDSFPGPITQRTTACRGDLVIGRYSVLPYYRELEIDLDAIGARLLNTYAQHRFIADLQNWAELLGPHITPPAISDFSTLSDTAKYVVKGETNSRKNDWSRSMFATSRADAIRIRAALQQDGLLCDQIIYARPYVPLRQLRAEPGIGGQPVTEEYRFFCCYGKILCGAYYWSQYADDLPEIPAPDENLHRFVEDVLEMIGDRAAGVVVDVGIKEDGRPIVVELNDLQMSGLSCNDPDVLYQNLRDVVRAEDRE